jgi:putative ABC transport system ATP-binding protein
MHAIQFESIVKEFSAGESTIRVLDRVSAQVNLGELTMLVGPSGCGKTTLISILTGILSATSGAVSVLGKQLQGLRDIERVLLRRQHIGFIFQQYNLLPALTAAENAAMPLFAAGVATSEALKRSRAVLTDIGMEEHTEKLPRQLSGGQQQRVAIARALVHEPALIVCDEPTAALDAKTGHGVMEILRGAANNKNRAAIVVTHDNRIYSFADRILAMNDGKIVQDMTVNEFLAKEKQ